MDSNDGIYRRKGCMILIKPGLQHSIQQIRKIQNGTHIILAIELQGIKYIIVNYYGDS
jgi:hypothetical protein